MIKLCVGGTMKVKILGTGSIYSKSNCASLIIDKNILMDIGPGTIKQLLKENYDLKKIDTILLTHLHSDHILDFPTFIVNIEVLGLNHKINIYSPKGAKEKLLSLVKLMYGNYFDNFIHKYLNFIEIFDEFEFKIENHIIKVKEVIHTGIEAYGFIIDSKLGISGDSSLCDNIKYILGNCNIMICDCSQENGDIYHMGIDDIKEIISQHKSLKIIPTHFRDNTKKILKRLNLNNVYIVEDGYEFEVED